MNVDPLIAPFSAFYRHWSLTSELTRRDILGRYRGANFGLLWALLSPLFILCIYSVAFGEILKSRWQSPAGTVTEFAPVLFLGIIVHGFFAECLARSPKLMQDNVSYVKRVVFPLHVLSWSVALSALFHLVMNVLIFLALAGLVFGGVSSLTFLLPVVIAPLILLTVAISWFLASLGVYIRDIQQVVPVLTTAMFFLSSAVIPVNVVPEKYRFLFEVNPLTFFIDQARNVALWGVPPDWSGLSSYTLASLVILYAAYAWLRLTSKGFADVL